MYTESKSECEYLTRVVHDLLRDESLVINTDKPVRLVDRITFCGFEYNADTRNCVLFLDNHTMLRDIKPWAGDKEFSQLPPSARIPA